MSDGFLTILFYLCAAALLGLGSCAYSDWQCDRIQSETGNPTRFELGPGCMVKIKGRWVPYDRWRAVDE